MQPFGFVSGRGLLCVNHSPDWGGRTFSTADHLGGCCDCASRRLYGLLPPSRPPDQTNIQSSRPMSSLHTFGEKVTRIQLGGSQPQRSLRRECACFRRRSRLLLLKIEMQRIARKIARFSRERRLWTEEQTIQIKKTRSYPGSLRGVVGSSLSLDYALQK